MRTRSITGPTTAVTAALGVLLGATAPSVQEAEAQPRRFVRVRVDVANLRSRPSLEAGRVRRAYENEPLCVVGQQCRWLEVRDFANEAAWIYGPLTDGRRTLAGVMNLVNVRERPGTGYPVVFTAERGVNLLVLERSGRGLHVRHGVGDGWLHDSRVWGPR